MRLHCYLLLALTAFISANVVSVEGATNAQALSNSGNQNSLRGLTTRYDEGEEERGGAWDNLRSSAMDMVKKAKLKSAQRAQAKETMKWMYANRIRPKSAWRYGVPRAKYEKFMKKMDRKHDMQHLG